MPLDEVVQILLALLHHYVDICLLSIFKCVIESNDVLVAALAQPAHCPHLLPGVRLVLPRLASQIGMFDDILHIVSLVCSEVGGALPARRELLVDVVLDLGVGVLWPSRPREALRRTLVTLPRDNIGDNLLVLAFTIDLFGFVISVFLISRMIIDLSILLRDVLEEALVVSHDLPANTSVVPAIISLGLWSRRPRDGRSCKRAAHLEISDLDSLCIYIY